MLVDFPEHMKRLPKCTSKTENSSYFSPQKKMVKANSAEHYEQTIHLLPSTQDWRYQAKGTSMEMNHKSFIPSQNENPQQGVFNETLSPRQDSLLYTAFLSHWRSQPNPKQKIVGLSILVLSSKLKWGFLHFWQPNCKCSL